MQEKSHGHENERNLIRLVYFCVHNRRDNSMTIKNCDTETKPVLVMTWKIQTKLGD